MPEQARTMLSRIKTYFRKSSPAFDEMKSPEEAYNLWAKQYDAQPENLVLTLEQGLFEEFISDLDITGAFIVDVGCGTGRHWQRILDRQPASLVGYDVSQGMLEQLKIKFPNAHAVRQKDYHLPDLNNQSCDLILSTLALGHMENIHDVLTEWVRVLKPGGRILITDYHPEALRQGSNRTFRYGRKLMAVKSHAHPIALLSKTAATLGLKIIASKEKFIDETTKSFYQKQHALDLFERFKGLPLLHALLLIKQA